MTIYSYYIKKDNEEIKEELYEHIKLGLQNIDNMDINFINKLERLFGIKDLKRILKLSFLFHDLGKVYYQKNFKEYNKEEVKFGLSFIGHEVFSTILFHCFKDYLLNEENKSNKILNIIKFSILYHHHAMDLEERIKQISNSKLSYPAEEDLKYMFKHLQEELDNLGILQKINLLNDIILKYDYRGDVKGEIEEIEGRIWNYYVSDANFRKLALMILSSLISIDYISVKREDSSGEFSSIAKEFYSLFLRKSLV